jgi:hypothetical protein
MTFDHDEPDQKHVKNSAHVRIGKIHEGAVHPRGSYRHCNDSGNSQLLWFK